MRNLINLGVEFSPMKVKRTVLLGENPCAQKSWHHRITADKQPDDIGQHLGHLSFEKKTFGWWKKIFNEKLNRLKLNFGFIWNFGITGFWSIGFFSNFDFFLNPGWKSLKSSQESISIPVIPTSWWQRVYRETHGSLVLHPPLKSIFRSR